MENQFTVLKKLFLENHLQPHKSIEKIYKLTKTHPDFNRILQKKETSKFNNLFETAKIKNVKETEDISPLNIIGSVRPPRDYLTSINKLLQRNDFIKFFTKHNIYDSNYFFENLYEIDKEEAIICQSFNDKNNNKFYFISHGHHRCIIAMFLQMIEPTYKLKGILVEEHTLNWENNQNRKFLNIFN